MNEFKIRVPIDITVDDDLLINIINLLITEDPDSDYCTECNDNQIFNGDYLIENFVLPVAKFEKGKHVRTVILNKDKLVRALDNYLSNCTDKRYLLICKDGNLRFNQLFLTRSVVDNIIEVLF